MRIDITNSAGQELSLTENIRSFVVHARKGWKDFQVYFIIEEDEEKYNFICTQLEAMIQTVKFEDKKLFINADGHEFILTDNKLIRGDSRLNFVIKCEVLEWN